MVKKARLAVEACDQELKDKAREVAALKMDRQRKKQQIDELDSIVRLKQAEADMFDLKASEARRESERIQRIVLAKSEKSEEDYVYIECSREARRNHASKGCIKQESKATSGI
ncbi:CONSTANS interacting protein 6 [Heracleum sosnowskyi]|uniref:CONSTANS interacting protein 6 n=1 Tax=Heracleum sosnowskyi TaxID=360622 RepID=A0AAD8MNP2_9APIA|nr:CONSTANS interacting protein 6 [Heracleum sosnowskyi]